jgi:hypothetical protein
LKLIVQVPVKFVGTVPPNVTASGLDGECELTPYQVQVWEAVGAQVIKSPASSSTADPGHVTRLPGPVVDVHTGDVIRGARSPSWKIGTLCPAIVRFADRTVVNGLAVTEKCAVPGPVPDPLVTETNEDGGTVADHEHADVVLTATLKAPAVLARAPEGGVNVYTHGGGNAAAT